MKFFKNKIVIGAILIVLALLLTFVLGPIAQLVTSRNVEVVRAKTGIIRGEIITEEQVEKIQVGKYNLPQDIIKDVSLAIGNYAVCDMQTGDYLTATKVSKEIPYDDNYLYELPQGKLAISVDMYSSAASLSGKLRADDIISVYAMPNSNSSAAAAGEDIAEQIIKASYALAPKELQYVKVLAVVEQSEKDVDETSSEENTNTDTEQKIQTIILEVSPAQASLLAGLNGINKLHFALVTRGDTEAAEKYLKIQDGLLVNAAQATPEVQPPQPTEPETENTDTESEGEE